MGVRNVIQNVTLEHETETYTSSQFVWDMCKLKIRDHNIIFASFI